MEPFEMDERRRELSQLKAYTENIEKEVSLWLQNLEWTPNSFEKNNMVVCKHDKNHSIPADKRDAHEEQCYLTQSGYNKEDLLLPEPMDANATTVVKYSKKEITEIINKAEAADRLFQRGVRCEGPEPLTLGRLQQAYSADERRAIYDAVVRSAPSCHDLTDLELVTPNASKGGHKKSRLEILAELRDMKRRRAKYRVAPKTRNYSDVLRDVIKTQMDAYGEATRTIINTEYGPNRYVSQKEDISDSAGPQHQPIKQERESSEERTYHRKTDDYKRNYSIDSSQTRNNSERREHSRDSPSKYSHNRIRSGDRKDSRFHSTEGKRKDRHDDGDNRHKSTKERDSRCVESYRSTDKGRKERDDESRIRNKDVSKKSQKYFDGSHRQEYSREHTDRARDAKLDGHRYRESYSSNYREKKKYHEEDNQRNKHPEYEICIKQEHERDAEDTRDSKRDASRDRHTKRTKNYSKELDFRKSHKKSYNQEEYLVKRDKVPESDGGDSRYKERRDIKRKYLDDTYYSRSEKEYDSGKRRREYSDVSMKQERESP